MRWAVPLTAAATALILALPGAAGAATGCLTTGEKTTAKRLRDVNVCLKASRLGSGVGRKVTFTAETNAPVEKDARRLIVVDVTRHETIGICINDRLCRIERVEDKAGVHKYVAVIGGINGVPAAKRPRSNTLRVLWLDLDLELSAYAIGRGPDDPNPAKLCDPDGCGTNTVGRGNLVNFYIRATAPIPKGLELVLETVHRGDYLDSRWSDRGQTGPPVSTCWHGSGCNVFGQSGETSDVFIASVYLHDDDKPATKADRLLSSNRIEMSWKDWDPGVTFDRGTRSCDSSGKSCIYKNSTLSASVKQPLEPGVVVILYLAKHCVPKPGDPKGDPGCSAYSPKDCSPPAQVCTFTGDVPSGYEPGALVVHNTPRPMLVFGSTFLSALP